MGLNEIINKIESNQILISKHGTFDINTLNRINYKFRLDWNYYSNSIEGGTLTKAETRSVMVGNIDVQGKPLKDVMEMNGHDKIVLEVLKMGKSDIHISEKRIKDIHRAIMHEENPNLIKEVGNWKSEPNEIINYKGEKISFTMPNEVPEKVHQLIDKTNADLGKFFSNKPLIHPIQIAAQFHIDFISIHPFYDGNGRTTRILTNILLMACGYPIIIVKESHKKQYYQILADIQVYGGNNQLFYEFIGERIIESQELILKAINGEDIDEKDDIDKEIDFFKKQIIPETLIKAERKKDNTLETIEKSFIPLVNILLEKINQFDELFFVKSNRFLFHNVGKEKYDFDKESGGRMLSMDKYPDAFNTWIRNIKNLEDVIERFGIEFKLDGFKVLPEENVRIYICIVFQKYKVKFFFKMNNKKDAIPLAEYRYGYNLKGEELTQLTSKIIKEFLEYLKEIKEKATLNK